ncbi:hypothetical protein BCR43DRAFT_485345 [Syncephalastrum racemosum]|uniref:GAR domain-containing protein n=1 Tax=Syncephalastrum racemosum TaxID=13706 RepID=A0A1X2HMC9_SYNRA|nr:hypothetical protein BCR43DRAFT_485345 [Syncephalastrum racemosum]
MDSSTKLSDKVERQVLNILQKYVARDWLDDSCLQHWRDGKALLCLADLFESVSDLESLLLQGTDENRLKIALPILRDRAGLDPNFDDTDQLYAFLDTLADSETIITGRLHTTNIQARLTRTVRTRTGTGTETGTDDNIVLSTLQQLRQQLTVLATACSLAKDEDDEEEAEASLIDEVGQFERDLEYARTLVADFETDDPATARAVEAAKAALDQQIEDHLDAIHADLKFRRSARPIRHALESIQTKMLQTPTTEQDILDLEHDVACTGADIQQLPATSLKAHVDALVAKHRIIASWVDEVRVWFVEAERIRHWIKDRITKLESMPLEDPFALDITSTTADSLACHSQVQEDIQTSLDEFDKQDISRLRQHVKDLTGQDREADLSPADTTTIEITFTALATLDRLKHLLRKRTYDWQMLYLRLDWENAYADARSWVTATAATIEQFIHDGRWNRGRTEQADNDVIQTLLALEQQAAMFDQGQFTSTINAYQGMDDTSTTELPAHLETRQVELEEAFEALTHRLSFARHIVEQRLSVSAFFRKADALDHDARQLLDTIEAASHECDPALERDLEDRADIFQEEAVQLVTTDVSHIRYPDHPDNAETNEIIASAIASRSHALVSLGEAIEDRLKSYRQVLIYLSRANGLLAETNRLDKSIKPLLLAAQEPISCDTQEAVDRACNQCKDAQSTLDHMQDDACHLRSDVHQLLDDTASLAASLPIAAVQDNLADIEAKLAQLQSLLSERYSELEAAQTNLDWQAQQARACAWTEETIQLALDLAQQSVSQPEEHEHCLDEVTALVQRAHEARLVKMTSEVYDRLSTPPAAVVQKQMQLQEKCKLAQDSANDALCTVQQQIACETFMHAAQDLRGQMVHLNEELQAALSDLPNPQTFDLSTLTQDLKRSRLLADQVPTLTSSNISTRLGVDLNGRPRVITEQGELEDQMEEIHQLHQVYQAARASYDQVHDLTQRIDSLASHVAEVTAAVLADQRSPTVVLSSAEYSSLRARTDSEHRTKYNECANTLSSLQQAVQDLCLDSHVTADPAETALAQLQMRLDTLDQALDAHRQALDFHAARLAWEAQVQRTEDHVATLSARLHHGRRSVDMKRASSRHSVDMKRSSSQLDWTGLATSLEATRQAFGKVKAWDIPDIQQKQDALEQTASKLQQQVQQREADMAALAALLAFEETAAKFLLQHDALTHELEQFIEQARNHEQEVKTNFQALSERVEQYTQKANFFLQDTQFEKSDRHALLKTAVSMLLAHIDFARQVLQQQDALKDCLQEADAAEAEADRAKEILFRSQEASCEAYDTFVAAFTQKSAKIPLPVRRDNRGDVQHNQVVREMLQTRQDRLNELRQSLTAILEAHSRQQALLQAYVTEAERLENWVDARQRELDGIAEADGLEGLRDAAAALDATQSAIHMYSSARKSLDETYEACQQDSLKERHACCVQRWEALQLRVAQTQATVHTHLQDAERKRLMDSFKDACASIRTSVDAAPSDVTDDVLDGWRRELAKVMQTHESVADPGEVASVEKSIEAAEQRMVEYQLQLEYEDLTDGLEEFVRIEGVCPMRVDGVSEAGDREAYHACQAAHQDLARRVQAKTEAYSDQQAAFAMMPDHAKPHKRQAALRAAWDALEARVSHAGHIANVAAQWQNLHQQLRTLSTKASQDADLDALTAEADACYSLAQALKEEEGYGWFEAHYDRVLSELKEVAEERARQAKQARADRIKRRAAEEIQAIQTRIELSLDEAWELTKQKHPASRALCDQLKDALEDGTHAYEAVQELEGWLAKEAQWQTWRGRARGHAATTRRIMTWMEGCKRQLETDHYEDPVHDVEAIQERIRAFEKTTLADYRKLTETIYYSEADAMLGVRARATSIDAAWQELKQSAMDAEEQAHAAARALQAVRRIREIMAMLGDYRDKLDRIRVPEGDLSQRLRQGEAEHLGKLMDQLEAEATARMEQEAKDLTDTDSREVEHAMANLKQAMNDKRASIGHALAVGRCLVATDDTNVLIHALGEAVDKATPASEEQQKSKLLRPMTSRADLKAKLIELDVRYKYYEKEITDKLAAVAESLKMVQGPDQDAVRELHDQLKVQWQNLDARVQTREAELSKAMGEGGVRVRKSSMPTRKAQTKSSLPVPTSTLSTALPRPSLSNRNSTSRLRQPTPLKKSAAAPPNAYVADPHNDLDMEIGRIVNETPYKVKVKMVPGEVGRYWFGGDDHPKLAYCRVLKSKMVMVRVGGGWTELSQFLRDHALLEGGDLLPKPAKYDLQDGFIEHSGRSRRLESSHSTPHKGGYMEGDKFITVDEHGNQREVKMTRAQHPSTSLHAATNSTTARRRRAERKQQASS